MYTRYYAINRNGICWSYFRDTYKEQNGARGFLKSHLDFLNIIISGICIFFSICTTVNCSEFTKDISWNRKFSEMRLQNDFSPVWSITIQIICAWYECMNTNSFFFKLNLTLIWQKTNNCVYSYDDTICKLIYVAWFKNNQPYHKRTN